MRYGSDTFPKNQNKVDDKNCTKEQELPTTWMIFPKRKQVANVAS
jgi:hypothetical protein